MPSQNEIFKSKQQFIEKVSNKLDDTWQGLAETLYKLIIEELVDGLDRENGIISNTTENLKKIALIESIYNQFVADHLPDVAAQVNNGANRISGYNFDYFSEYAGERDYKATTQKIQKIIRDRLGITAESNGKKVRLKPGGYMDSLLSDNTIKTELKNITYREVLKNVGYNDLKKGLERFIVGDEETLGGFRQFYRNYAYDIFVEIDRHESSLLATDLDLKYFIYEGTIIKTSRPFCRKRAGNVYSITEAQEWVNDPWIKKNLKKGYIVSYNPINDMGLFGCRHIPRFISEEVAFAMRPDLKKAA